MLDSLVSNWHFENNGIDSVSGHTASFWLGGSFVTTPVMIGTYCRDNDGFDSYGIVAHHTDYNNTSFTMVTWVYPDVAAGADWSKNPFLMTKDNTNSSARDKSIWILAFGGVWQARCTTYFTDATASQLSYASGVSYGAKHCIIQTFDNTTKAHSFYVDGYLRGKAIITGKTVVNTNNQWRFGTRRLIPGDNFDGKYDEYAYFSRAISDGGVSVDTLCGGEVAQIWANGDGVAIDTLAAEDEVKMHRMLGRGLGTGLGRGL